MKKQDSGVAAIVLAAGMSRRMGSPKQLLRIHGKTVLQHALDNVRNSQLHQIVLVLGAQADEIQKQVSAKGIHVVINPDFQQGMGTSLRTGVAALRPETKAALVVLADQPFVSPSTLDHLIAWHGGNDAQIVIPTYRRFRGNPVLLDRVVFPELTNLSGDVGCRAIFGNHAGGIHKLAVDDPGILLDIDSVEDWSKLSSSAEPLSHLRQMPELEVRQQSTANRPELVIVGHDEVARALIVLGRILDFTITVVDPLLALEDFPGADRALHVLDFSRLPAASYVVIASRGQFDEEAVEQAIGSGAAYIALLANRRRADEIFAALETRRILKSKLAEVRAPAGLNIGAQNAQEIALSIMAEIIAERRQSYGMKSSDQSHTDR